MAGGIVIGGIRVLTNAGNKGRQIIAFQVMGKDPVHYAREICSLMEAALKAEGIDTQYDDVRPGVFTLENTASFASDDTPSAQRMEKIAFRALKEAQEVYSAGNSLDDALTEARQKYEGHGFTDEDERRPVESHDDEEPIRGYRPGRRIKAHPEGGEEAPEVSLRSQLIEAFQKRLNAICGPTSAITADARSKSAQTMADQLLAIPEEARTEETILKFMQGILKIFCDEFEIKKTFLDDGKPVDKTAGFISWQAAEAKSAIVDILTETPGRAGGAIR